MFKCTGICSRCGRCQNSAMISGANDRKSRLVSFPDDFRPSAGGEGYGAAFDIGTTTVVGMLWDLNRGTQIATCAETNPQNEFGMDVISRITYCGKESENLNRLRKKITDCINEIIDKLCQKSAISEDEIVKATVCGNTTMSHLFAGYPVMSLAMAPFIPAYTGILELTAEDAGLKISRRGSVTVLPNIAGHVGGDITAGIVATRLLGEGGLTAFIDIGTNGEIVITDGKADGSRTLACSTAAGPAFEGSAIEHGMRAATGAIESVRIEDGEVFFRTIGQCEPQGICGSGLIDAVAQMLKAGIIKKNGRMISPQDVDKAGISQAFKDRLFSMEKERCFTLVSREKGEDIIITQNDIREVQLAKGAVEAGINLMLSRLGKTTGELNKVIVAGAFGSYIDKESAVAIGLLPDIDRERIIFAGNTAGAGVSMALVNHEEMDRAQDAASRIQHVELAECDAFQDVYMKAMAFK